MVSSSRDIYTTTTIICSFTIRASVLPEDVREQAVGPLAGVGVQRAVQVFLADGLGVDDVGHALHALQPLQGLEQHAPRQGLPAARGAHHHQAVVDLGDLVQLQHLEEGGGGEGHTDERSDSIHLLFKKVPFIIPPGVSVI